MSTRSAFEPSIASQALAFWVDQYRSGVRINARHGDLVLERAYPEPHLRIAQYGSLQFPQETVEIDPLVEFELEMYRDALVALLQHEDCPDVLAPYVNQIMYDSEYRKLILRTDDQGVRIAAAPAPGGLRTYFAGKKISAQQAEDQGVKKKVAKKGKSV